jgi:hypothetical protein
MPSSCAHQARYLHGLDESKPEVWHNIPELLEQRGIRTRTGKSYTIRIINHWKTPGSSRRMPPECIPVVAAAYADQDSPEEHAKEIEAALRREQDKDGGSRGDFWIKTDEALKGFRILKPIFPPFTSPRRNNKSGRSHHSEEPFLDFCINRWAGFSGHRITVSEETDLSRMLETMVADRHATKIGFGLLSSMERIALLQPLHMPIRVGLNAVCILRGEQDKSRLPQIRDLLLGKQTDLGDAITIISAKHEVGWTHLQTLLQEKIVTRLQLAPALQNISTSDYIQRLTRASESISTKFAIADEITCLSILKDLRARKTPARLVFQLATSKSVEARKPEFLMSIMLKRGQRETVEVLTDTLWMLLQGDVELLAEEYVKLSHKLCAFAIDAGADRETAEDWARYTLRLSPEYLQRYVDQHLPWKPILERAVQIIKDKR